MTIWTREELTRLLAEWKKALSAAATGKSYTIADGGTSRTLTRYDLDEIRKMISWLEDELAQLEGRHGPFFVHARYVTGRKR